tara:strand:- start:1023 stop:1274 length:252 start_codon:yes stop_codon:yes gene_type:complete
MLHKMVTLCPASHDIAQRMKNFSLFVRRATLATEEGGLELVEPSQIPSVQMLAILLSREQEVNGFGTDVGLDISNLIQHFRNI